ncbi:MAG: nuclear transport factor 2 family protein [Thermoleophilia bacterium]|nr:nuclear transport factor 2 family protein [Thermoleophilia bacterium]
MIGTDHPNATAEENRNLEAVERWGDLYNNDVHTMVSECYSPDYVVEIKGIMSYRGLETFHVLESAALDVAPNRRAESERIMAQGDRVIIQGFLLDPDEGPDWRTPFCTVLTFVDGLIVHDETYIDITSWPAPRLTAEQLTELDIELARPVAG